VTVSFKSAILVGSKETKVGRNRILPLGKKQKAEGLQTLPPGKGDWPLGKKQKAEA
jgi:hypothetical protein